MLNQDTKNKIEFIKEVIREQYENNDNMFLPSHTEQTRLIKSLLNESRISVIKSKVKDYMVENCSL